MTITLLLQALLAPLIVLGVATVTRAWYPLILAAGFWAISLWVKGTTIGAMDSVAMAFTLAAINSLLADRVKARVRLPVTAVLLVLLSIWQVKNFASDINVGSWAIQFAFLAVALVLPEWKATTAASESKLLNQFDVASLFWLIPVGALAFMTPLAGSIVVGQISGLIAMLVFGSWFYTARGQASGKQVALLVATPALFIAQMAWHYVEIPWTSLAVAIIGWLPLLWPGLKKQPWWLQAILVIVFFAAILGTQLYLEWPEESLY